MSPVATLRTRHADAETVAAALAPDNTDEMTMEVESDSDAGVSTDSDGDAGTASDAGAGTIVTTIERETTGGLAATVDDYVVNLSVATAVAEYARPDRSRSAGDESTNEAANETTTSDASTTTTSTRPATPDESTESQDDTSTHDNE